MSTQKKPANQATMASTKSPNEMANEPKLEPIRIKIIDLSGPSPHAR